MVNASLQNLIMELDVFNVLIIVRNVSQDWSAKNVKEDFITKIIFVKSVMKTALTVLIHLNVFYVLLVPTSLKENAINVKKEHI